MEEKKDKNIEAIAKLITLTRDGKLHWISIDQSEVYKNEGDFIDSVFTTTYKEKILRLYRRKYKGPSISAQISSFFSSTVKTTELQWHTEIILELIDASGRSLWSFPKEEILKDLLKTIKYKVSGADELISNLLNE